jgi:hypothetical protein
MDVKTLSAMMGHISSATTLDVYSHITNDMQIRAARCIDRSIGKVDTSIDEDAVPQPIKRERSNFKPKEPKSRKPGSGGIYQLNDHLWEGKYSPKNAVGKREYHNVYAKTREECQILLDARIEEVRTRILAEKAACQR